MPEEPFLNPEDLERTILQECEEHDAELTELLRKNSTLLKEIKHDLDETKREFAAPVLGPKPKILRQTALRDPLRVPLTRKK